MKNITSFISIILGIIFIGLGIISIGFYIITVISVLGQADQSLIYWYIIFALMGIGFIKAGRYFLIKGMKTFSKNS